MWCYVCSSASDAVLFEDCDVKASGEDPTFNAEVSKTISFGAYNSKSRTAVSGIHVTDGVKGILKYQVTDTASKTIDLVELMYKS